MSSTSSQLDSFSSPAGCSRCSFAPSWPSRGSHYFDQQTYNGLFSAHVALMIFLFIIPAFAGLANFVVPLMLGAADMAFPRLERTSRSGSCRSPGHDDAELIRDARRRLRRRLDGLRHALLPAPAHRRDLLQPGSPVGGCVVDHDGPQLPRDHHHDAGAGDDVLAVTRSSSGRTSRPRCSSWSQRRSSPARSSSRCSIT